jgi:hypothetical protein
MKVLVLTKFRRARLQMLTWFALAALATFTQPTMAMEFSHIVMPDGLKVVFAKGEIVAGDAERLRIALDSADRDPSGNKNLALDSNGGSVVEALTIVSLIDMEKVTTIVPAGASCASACAQIIFISGKQHVVVDGGYLGMHSCSVQSVANQLCNELIARNALMHGTDYGSVMAFMRFVSPDKVMWFSSTQADCWGLTRWPAQFKRGVKQGEEAPCVYNSITQRKSNSETHQAQNLPSPGPPPTLPPSVPDRSSARFRETSCGSIVDNKTGFEWYVGPDADLTWTAAENWVQNLRACGKRWALPAIGELRSLFDRAFVAGSGYMTSGQHWPAHIEPIFSGIGHGSWVWAQGQLKGSNAPAFNFNQGIEVRISANNFDGTVRGFAVSK